MTTPEERLLHAYLDCHRRWVGRDELQRLFWPDRSEDEARGGLEQLLEAALAGAGGDALEIGPWGARRRPARTPPQRQDPPASPAPLRNFPPETSPFVGRERELAQLRSLILETGARLVTLAGPPGVGKSRLARHLAGLVAPRLRQGAALLPLSEPEQLPEALVTSQGLILPPPLPPSPLTASALQKRLGGLEMLLLIDGFDAGHDSAPLLELLDAGAGLRLLVTSDEALDLHAESLYQLAGLTFPAAEAPAENTPLQPGQTYDALALLLHLARRADPTFRPASAARTELLETTRLLEGHPLALELIAPWLRQLTPAEVREGLRLLLECFPPHCETIPRSLRAAFAYSSSLLSGDARGALQALAALPESAAPLDRETVRNATGTSLTTLLRLVKKALLDQNEAGRFGFHPAIRHLVRTTLPP